MISILLTGHGEFATGLAHSLQMITGTQTQFKVVPFTENCTPSALENALSDALVELLHQSDGVVIFTDILGGTPFKSAMLTAQHYTNVEVVCGTNLPMLIEIALTREFETSATDIARQAVNIGKETVIHASFSSSSSTKADSDGI